jgi:allophanate hydrolase subunit 2
MDAFSILTPGGYTTIQDKGRFGYQQMGVPISGALDAFAFRAANLLVGNLKNAAVMEITVMGPRLEIAVEADMAVTGAEIGMTLNDQPVEGWMSFRVKPGDILDIQQVKSGCRAYLAISGGIDVTEVMGSRSTYVGGKIGGFHGRVLQAGDVLKCGETKRLAAVRKTPADMIPAYPSEIVIRAIPGPQDDFFQAGLDISEPTMPGGVQIPADEQPIILMVEQTVGGYTKIVTVISVDLPKVAQATPGDTIRFEKVSLETAHLLYQEQLKKLHDLEESLSRQ